MTSQWHGPLDRHAGAQRLVRRPYFTCGWRRRLISPLRPRLRQPPRRACPRPPKRSEIASSPRRCREQGQSRLEVSVASRAVEVGPGQQRGVRLDLAGLNGSSHGSPTYAQCRKIGSEGSRMVRSRGLEPPRLAALTPQASASTNSATTASFGKALDVAEPRLGNKGVDQRYLQRPHGLAGWTLP